MHYDCTKPLSNAIETLLGIGVDQLLPRRLPACVMGKNLALRSQAPKKRLSRKVPSTNLVLSGIECEID